MELKMKNKVREMCYNGETHGGKRMKALARIFCMPMIRAFRQTQA